MTDSELIDKLGGTFKVAEMCEVKPPSVSDWRIHGIPNSRRMYLRAIWPDAGWPELPLPKQDEASSDFQQVAVQQVVPKVDQRVFDREAEPVEGLMLENRRVTAKQEG